MEYNIMGYHAVYEVWDIMQCNMEKSDPCNIEVRNTIKCENECGRYHDV